MTLRSPGRVYTFFSVLLIAILIMSADQWDFILNSYSTEGLVRSVGYGGRYTVDFQVLGNAYVLNGRPIYGLPEYTVGEEIRVRYMLDKSSTPQKVMVSWFWTLFHYKIMILLIMTIPWFAFVWSMPAKWRLVLGKSKGRPEDQMSMDTDRQLGSNGRS